MSELRQDPVTAVWAVMAPGRAARPKEFGRTILEGADAAACPFCPGREDATPPTRWHSGAIDDEGWSVRVVENKFPALSAADDDDGYAVASAPGPYVAAPGFGAHEVIIETPRHSEGLADYSAEHAALLVEAYASRLAHWRDDGRFAAALLFRNWGWAAGASLSHAHTQLVALPRVPDALIREMGAFSGAASAGHACPLCGAIEADNADDRTVWDDGITTVQSPFAAPIPYFMRIAPRHCAASLTDASAEDRASFGAALVAAAQAIRGAFGDVAFNVVVHVAPFTAQRVVGLPFHWHADVIIRTSDQAGFEWGSGVYINVVDPDEAAATLRGGLSRETG